MTRTHYANNELHVYSRTEETRRKASFIEEVSGIRFYEDPYWGDETGLWAVFKGKVAPTDYFSVPDAEEIEDPADFFECYAAD